MVIVQHLHTAAVFLICFVDILIWWIFVYEIEKMIDKILVRRPNQFQIYLILLLLLLCIVAIGAVQKKNKKQNHKKHPPIRTYDQK